MTAGPDPLNNVPAEFLARYAESIASLLEDAYTENTDDLMMEEGIGCIIGELRTVFGLRMKDIERIEAFAMKLHHNRRNEQGNRS